MTLLRSVYKSHSLLYKKYNNDVVSLYNLTFFAIFSLKSGRGALSAVLRISAVVYVLAINALLLLQPALAVQQQYCCK